MPHDTATNINEPGKLYTGVDPLLLSTRAKWNEWPCGRCGYVDEEITTAMREDGHVLCGFKCQECGELNTMARTTVYIDDHDDWEESWY